MPEMYQCSKCLGFFEDQNLIIVEYLKLDLIPAYTIVCHDCSQKMEVKGILVTDDQDEEERNIIDRYCEKYGVSI